MLPTLTNRLVIVHAHCNKRLFYGYLKITKLSHENSSKDIRISALSSIYQGFGHGFYSIFIYFNLQFCLPITNFFFFFLKIHLFDVHFFTKIFLCLITSSKEQILSLNFTVNIKVSMTSNYETVKSLLKYKQKPWS